MKNAPAKTPKNCFACLKKAATRNAFASMLISAGALAAAFYGFNII